MKRSFVKMSILPKDINKRYELISRVLDQNNGNISQTANTLKITPNCVKTVRKWVEDGKPYKQQQGRPQKLTDNIKYFIVIKTLYFPETSGADLSNLIMMNFQVEVSDDTINNFRKKVAFKYGPRVRALPLTQLHMFKRYTFSRWFLSNRFDHQRFIFSDESWFEIGTQNHYVWRVTGEVYPTVLKEDLVKPPKVMIWGAIGYNFKSNLVIFTQSVNSQTYINQAIKGSRLKEFADYTYGPGNWVFQQDNARPHTSKYSITALKNLGINFLASWPPHSPDLSPIEIIWAIMGQRVEKYRPKDIISLKEILFYVWNNLSFQTINALIESFPKKLNQCIINGGNQVRF